MLCIGKHSYKRDSRISGIFYKTIDRTVSWSCKIIKGEKKKGEETMSAWWDR